MNTAIKILFAEEHLSASAIGKYLRCPRSYRYRYIDHRIPETRASSLLFGSAIHHSLAFYYSALRRIDPEPDIAELCDVFRGAWAENLDDGPPVLFGDDESADKLTDLGAKMLGAFIEKAPLYPEVVEVEMPFSVELADPDTGEVLPRLVGVLDAVVRERDGDGGYAILEHKTAAKRWTEDKLAFDNQITAYSLAAPQLGFGDDAAVVVQVFLKTKNPDLVLYRPHRSDADRRDLVDIVRGITRAVRAEAFHPIRDWHCRGCEYASACVAG
jgi:CRISPR/Cas system-associated exonuclease Cas4 (RecB family)